MSKVCIDEDKCVHCGACTAVCSSDALTMDTTNWTLFFTESNCTQCHVCIPACPLRSIQQN